MTIIAEPVKYRRYFFREGTSNGVYSGGTIQDIEQTFRTDQVDRKSDPNYAVKIAKRQNASNPYFRVGTKVTPYRFEMRDENYATRQRGHCVLLQVGNASAIINSSDDSTLRDQALMRLKNKLRSNIGTSSALVPIAELRDLKKTILGLAGLSLRGLRQWDKVLRKKGNALDRYKYASDSWLTWSFGVKPLMSDVSNISLSIQDYLDRTDLTFRVSGTASKRWSSGNNSTGLGTPFSDFKNYCAAHHYLSYSYTSGISALLLSGNNYGAVDHLGIGFKNLPSIGWELTPYSWVIDYFTTVGAYLDDTFVLPPGSTRYITLSKLYKLEATLTCEHVPRSGFQYQVSSRPGKLEHFSFTRSVITNLPHAALRFKTVDEMGLFAVNKLLNLAAVGISGHRL